MGPKPNEKHKRKLAELKAQLEAELENEPDPKRRELLWDGIGKINAIQKKGFDPTIIIAIITLIAELLKLLKPKT